jgi:2'-5' RNA ligase
MAQNEETPRSLRLFVAIELPDEVRDALAAASETLRRAGADRGLRWARPEGVHLTLKFLGAVPPDRVAAIHTALRLGVRDAAPMEVQPEGIGAFHGGGGRQPERHGRREAYHYNLRVLWAGFRAADRDALVALADRVEAALNPLGYAREKRPFFPHLTLARTRDDADRETREALYRALEPYLSASSQTGNFRPELAPRFPSFRAEHVSLMQSTLQPGGAVYRALSTFPLEGGGS